MCMSEVVVVVEVEVASFEVEECIVVSIEEV